ncbi:MAG: MerR family transcriptional regulator [Nitrospiria bacterium]
MERLTIGRLAEAAQVNIETIRYYERRGLIPKAPRRRSGYREFSQKDLERIRFIKHAKTLGFTLDEISELLALKVEPAATCGDITKKIDAKLVDVEGKLKTLLRMKETS